MNGNGQTHEHCDKEWQKRIRYVKIHFQDRRGAASLRYRNRAKITVLMCEQKPYSVWFSGRRKSYLVWNIASGPVYVQVGYPRLVR